MKFKIKKSNPVPGVIHLLFKNQYETCSTFMRLQEFYESPFKQIRGKLFSLEQLMDLYAKQQGNFTYTCDWGGFNVPGHVVDEFFRLYDGQLLEKEKDLRELVKDKAGKIAVGSKYYVIGMYGEECLDHELAHALYYLNDDYRRQVNGLVKALPESVKSAIAKWLLDKGYSKPLIVDETNAYLTTDDQEELTKRFGKAVGKRYAKYEPFRRAFDDAKF
jgi:hypothetical protein